MRLSLSADMEGLIFIFLRHKILMRQAEHFSEAWSKSDFMQDMFLFTPDLKHP